MRRWLIIICIMLPMSIGARSKVDSVLMNRVWNYKDMVGGLRQQPASSIYARFYLKTDKRNPLMLVVPSMYAIARGSKREFAGETWLKVAMDSTGRLSALRQLQVGTVPHNRRMLPTMANYLKSDIYDVIMVGNDLLSPFHRMNRIYYRYEVTRMSTQMAEISFRPKVYNTKLVSGSAIVDPETGRIESVTFFGEFDMIKFSLSATMGREGTISLYPQRCDMTIDFGFLGNRLSGVYYSEYGLPVMLGDSVSESHDRHAMDTLRPEPLPHPIAELYHIKDSIDALPADTTARKHRNNFVKRVLWDSFAEHLLNRTKTRFGKNQEGYMRLSPLFNPLYFGYSNHKGLIYKLKASMNYAFSENSQASLYLKGGYSFKQRQLYFNLPLRWTFDMRHGGYVEAKWGNGNRINNSSVVDQIKHEKADSIDWESLNLDYFKDMYMQTTAGYNLSDKWGLTIGYIFHRRSPVDEKGFRQMGKSTDYRSFAPTLSIQWRPWGWKGPIVTADYERGLKGVAKSEMDYERMEFDGSWQYELNPLRSLSMRLGCGFYTNRSKGTYFLDYTNFRDDNIPGGWDDDWAGDFQLLKSNWYNASEYYIRGNLTYETPMLLAYRLPWVGRYIESERIYVNVLGVENLHPYMEYGYGFTNRIFSMGAFLATSNLKYEGIGFRFGFELFRKW